MKRSAFVFISILFMFLSSANSESVKDYFENGVKLFGEGNYSGSSEAFINALRLDPGNPEILINLGINSSKQKEWGKSLAYFKSALSIDPSLEEAERGIIFVNTQLEVKELPHKITYWQTFREHFLIHTSVQWILLVFGISLLLFFWRLLALVKERSLAKQNEEAAPSPSLILIFVALLMTFNFIVLMGKFYDFTIDRAIVLPKKEAVFSSPQSDAVALFDLFEGMEVELIRIENEWAQITYPGGPSGWIKLQFLQKVVGVKPN